VSNEYFSNIDEKNKNFIVNFDLEMQESGFEIINKMTEGTYWGKTIIYAKSNIKNKKNIARISIKKNNDIYLRLYFSEKDIEKNMKYIENASSDIKSPFINDQGLCKNCGNENGWCHNRKIYTINGQQIKKCGYVFTFNNPNIESINDFVDILMEFYAKNIKKNKLDRSKTNST
jgi:hypothetical protein